MPQVPQINQYLPSPSTPPYQNPGSEYLSRLTPGSSVFASTRILTLSAPDNIVLQAGSERLRPDSTNTKPQQQQNLIPVRDGGRGGFPNVSTLLREDSSAPLITLSRLVSRTFENKERVSALIKSSDEWQGR